MDLEKGGWGTTGISRNRPLPVSPPATGLPRYWPIYRSIRSYRLFPYPGLLESPWNRGSLVRWMEGAGELVTGERRRPNPIPGPRGRSAARRQGTRGPFRLPRRGSSSPCGSGTYGRGRGASPASCISAVSFGPLLPPPPFREPPGRPPAPGKLRGTRGKSASICTGGKNFGFPTGGLSA